MAFNWQQKGWPNATVNRAALKDELDAFGAAFSRVKAALRKPQNPVALMSALVDEAVKTSTIEGVRVDESVVVSSICKALGIRDVPVGFTKDARAEGVAQMVLAVRRDWKKPLSAQLVKAWHGALLANDPRGVTVGDFRSHAEPMRVIRRNAYGEVEIRFEAPPSVRVPEEVERFVGMWRATARDPVDVALKCALLHPHFESIHPFEDGNGRVGRALVAKTLAEGLGKALVLPVSTVLDRYRKDYYEAIHEASQSLDWTDWAKFFIPVLSETLSGFLSAARFISAKGAYLSMYEGRISERAKAVILRMFRDGPAGVAAGLSAAKWMRMTKVSKPTATRDLAELAKTGAILAEGNGAQTRYRLAFDLDSHEPIDEPLNEPLNEPKDEGINEGTKRDVHALVRKSPGTRVPFIVEALGVSRATVKRALAALIAAGKVEHRGSKKTGGYFCIPRLRNGSVRPPTSYLP